jgi:2'-5' RNA ligase
MNRIRTFVAAELSQGTRRSLRREAERLADSGADVKWVAEENLHVTLKFLGQVDRRAVPDIMKAIESAARGVEPFRAEVAGVNLFPAPTRPRIVAAGLDPQAAERLSALAARLDDALVEIGFGREKRGFRAHITLGRVKGTKGVGALADAMLTADGRPFGEQDIDGVTLFMSELSRAGPRYTVLGRAPLNG